MTTVGTMYSEHVDGKRVKLRRVDDGSGALRTVALVIDARGVPTLGEFPDLPCSHAGVMRAMARLADESTRREGVRL